LLGLLPSIRTSRAPHSAAAAAVAGSSGMLTPPAVCMLSPRGTASPAAAAGAGGLSVPMGSPGMQQHNSAGAAGATSSTDLEAYAHALMNRMSELTNNLPGDLAAEVQQGMVQQVEQAAHVAQLSGRPFGFGAAVRVLEQARRSYTMLLPPPELGRVGSSSGSAGGGRDGGNLHGLTDADQVNMLLATGGVFDRPGSLLGGLGPPFADGSFTGGGSLTGGSGGGSFTRMSLGMGSFTGLSMTGSSPWSSFSSLRGGSVTGAPQGMLAAAVAAAYGHGPGSMQPPPPLQDRAAAAAAAAAGGAYPGPSAAAAAAAAGAVKEEKELQQHLRSLATAAAAMGTAAEAEALAAAVAAVAAPQASGVASCEVSGGGVYDDGVSGTPRSKRRKGRTRRR
jgi:hypothetical protein